MMIAALPRESSAPLDYRYALDAAMSVLAASQATFVICNVGELRGEVMQRIADVDDDQNVEGALWVEPSKDTWRTDLGRFAAALGPGAPLVVVASQPLAVIITERRDWDVPALGTSPGAIRKLRLIAKRLGFDHRASYGVHPATGIALNALGMTLERCGLPDWGDRLQFTARSRYCTDGPFKALSTVGLHFMHRTET